MTQTAAAHIITADAVALGDPEILIFEHDETGAGRFIERHSLPAFDPSIDLDACDQALNAVEPDAAWRTCSAPVLVERGYWIVNVERV